jgi:HSP20 family protein
MNFVEFNNLTNQLRPKRRKIMATLQTNQQQQALARRSGMASLPALWLDPFDLFNSNPVSLFRRMQDEMTRALAPSGRNRASGRTDGANALVWVPAIEVAEQDGNFVVSAELPGITDEDVTVEVSDDAIVIQGERQQEREDTQGGMHRTELRYGQFYRVIPLPDGANPDEARAEFVNGVLRISVPVAQNNNNVRQITIQTSSSTQQAGEKNSDQPAAKSSSSKSSETPPAQKGA